jgi:hypothetical protein
MAMGPQRSGTAKCCDGWICYKILSENIKTLETLSNANRRHGVKLRTGADTIRFAVLRFGG